jgi:hypothetical protein
VAGSGEDEDDGGGGGGCRVGANGAAMGRHGGAVGSLCITCLCCASYSGQTTRCCLPMGKHRSDFKCRSTETTRLDNRPAPTIPTYLTAPTMRPTKRAPDPDSKGRAHNSGANGTKGALGLVACPLTAAQDPAKQQRTIVTGCAEGEESTQAKYTKGNPPPLVHAPPVPNHTQMKRQSVYWKNVPSAPYPGNTQM